MDLIKNQQINDLLAIYDDLLTDKQKEYITLYYSEDYSLGEISELKNISRQAVFDNIKRTENILTTYESKLNLKEQFDQRSSVLKDLQRHVDNSYQHDEKLIKLIRKLNNLD